MENQKVRPEASVYLLNYDINKSITRPNIIHSFYFIDTFLIHL